MTNLAVTDDLFFTRTGMDPGRVERLVGELLHGMDDGELFLEYSQSESVALDDGRIRSASFDTTQGFGLRAVAEVTGPIEATRTPSKAAVPAAATKLCTVEELLKVIQWGLSTAPKISAAAAAAPSGAEVR